MAPASKPNIPVAAMNLRVTLTYAFYALEPGGSAELLSRATLVQRTAAYSLAASGTGFARHEVKGGE